MAGIVVMLDWKPHRGAEPTQSKVRLRFAIAGVFRHSPLVGVDSSLRT